MPCLELPLPYCQEKAGRYKECMAGKSSALELRVLYQQSFKAFLFIVDNIKLPLGSANPLQWFFFPDIEIRPDAFSSGTLISLSL